MDPDDARRRLADLEQDLAHSDPRLARRITLMSLVVLAAASPWWALAASLALLLLGAELLLLGLREHQPILIILSTLVLSGALAPYRRLHQ